MSNNKMVEVTETKFVSSLLVFPCYFGCNIYAYKVISTNDVIRVTLDDVSTSTIKVEIAETTLQSALKEPPITAIEFNDRFKKAVEVLSRSTQSQTKKLTSKKR